MASVKEIEKQISELEDIVKGLNDASPQPDGTYLYDGKKYSLKQLETLSSTAKKDITALTKVIKPVVDARKSIKSLSATGDPFTKMTPQQKTMVKKAEKKLSDLESKDYKTPKISSPLVTPAVPTVTAQPTTSTTTTPAPAPAQTQVTTSLTVDNKPVSQEERILMGISDTAKTLTAREIAAIRTRRSESKKEPDKPDKPVVTTTDTGGRKKGDTRTNSKGVNFTWDGKKWVRTATLNKGPDTTSEAWKTTIQEEFGSLWDVYNEDAELKKVIDTSVKEGWFNDPIKMEEKLRNTNWFRRTESSARKYVIDQSTDPATAEATKNKRLEYVRAESLKRGVTLSEATLDDLAEKSLKFGWTEQQITNGIGSEAVATANRGGTQGITDLRRGSTGTQLREIADNYGIKVSDTMLDQWTAEILQGTKTNVQFTDQMKNQASTMYRSLAPQIEKGVDVKTATSMYTNMATATLGIDASTIDWSQDKWNKALNYQDPKTNEYRQMDSWEWNRYLRAQPEWKKTDEAKEAYRNLAFSLASGFGKTL
jgi:hypothetical protein